MPKGYVEVTLHSTDAEAVEAVRQTLQMLPGVGQQNPLREQGGKFYVPEGMVAYAAVKQGYVKGVKGVSNV